MSRTLAFQFLCGCLARNLTEVRRHELRQIARLEIFPWETFVEIAGSTLVAPALFDATRANGLDDVLPADVVDFLDGMATLNRQRNERIHAEAVDLASMLNEREVVPVLLKGGAHLLSGLHAKSSHRIMIDLDLLVPESRLLDCAAAMRQHGYEMICDNGYPASHHYPPLSRPGGGVAVELHVRPLVDPDGPLLEPDEIFATAHYLHFGRATLAVPSAQARVIHTIVHTQLSNHDYLFGRLSLRELLDYARLCETCQNEIDWVDINSRFAAYRAATALAYQALAARNLLGVLIAADIRIGTLARILYRIAIWQVKYPHLLDFKIRLLSPWLLLRRSLSSVRLRKKLLHNLRDATWYRRHWRALRGRVPTSH
jgi:hypothetical protein